MLVASLHILANPYTLNKGIRGPYAISANPYIGTQLQSPSFSIMILVITSAKQNHFITIYFRIIIVMMTKMIMMIRYHHHQQHPHQGDCDHIWYHDDETRSWLSPKWWWWDEIKMITKIMISCDCWLQSRNDASTVGHDLWLRRRCSSSSSSSSNCYMDIAHLNPDLLLDWLP